LASSSADSKNFQPKISKEFAGRGAARRRAQANTAPAGRKATKETPPANQAANEENALKRLPANVPDLQDGRPFTHCRLLNWSAELRLITAQFNHLRLQPLRYAP
jgi:hypothetical protein